MRTCSTTWSEAKDKSFEGNQIFEIGGPRPASYGEIMIEYAHQRGLRRLMIPVPILTPHLSSLWLGLVTPLYARVGRKLVDSMRNETVVRDDRALREFDVRPRGLNQAIERALRNEDFEMAETRWSDAISSKGEDQPYGGERFGTRLVGFANGPRPGARRKPRSRLLEGIGGKTGWYGNDWMWRVARLLRPYRRRSRHAPRPARPALRAHGAMRSTSGASSRSRDRAATSPASSAEARR